MKIARVIILLILLSQTVNARQQRLSVSITGGMVQYDYSFWNFPDTINYYGFPLQQERHKFVNKLNFETGIGLSYEYNKLFFGINLLYSAKDYIVDYDFDTATAESGEVALGIDKSILRFRYFDTNLKFCY